MRKKVIFRESHFLKLIESFLIHKEAGNQSRWTKSLRKQNTDLADIWTKADKSLLKFMLATRKQIVKNGGDVAAADALIKKTFPGYKI